MTGDAKACSKIKLPVSKARRATDWFNNYSPIICMILYHCKNYTKKNRWINSSYHPYPA